MKTGYRALVAGFVFWAGMVSAVLAGPDEDLIDAIYAGDRAGVERLLAVGISPDPVRNEHGVSPLEAACGAASDHLALAGDEGRASDIRAIIGHLLAAGADPESRAFRNTGSYTGGESPLAAGKFAPDCIAPLLAAGADPNGRMTTDMWGEGKGLTVLEAGLQSGFFGPDQVFGLSLLLDAGADPHSISHEGLSLKSVLVNRFEEMLPYMVVAGGALRAAEVEYFKYSIYAYRVLHKAGAEDLLADTRILNLAAMLLESIEAAPMSLSEQLAETQQVLNVLWADRLEQSDHLDPGLLGINVDLAAELPLREVLSAFVAGGHAGL